MLKRGDVLFWYNKARDKSSIFSVDIVIGSNFNKKQWVLCELSPNYDNGLTHFFHYIDEPKAPHLVAFHWEE